MKYLNSENKEVKLDPNIICFKLIQSFLKYRIGELVEIKKFQELGKEVLFIQIGNVGLPLHHAFDCPHIFKPVSVKEFKEIQNQVNVINNSFIVNGS